MKYFTLVPEQKSKDPSDFLGNYDAARTAYKNSFCVAENSKYVMLGGDKYEASAPTIYENGNILVPAEMLASVYGFEYSYDEKSNIVSIGDFLKVKPGDTSIEYKGKSIALTEPVKKTDNGVYIELSAFAEKVLGKVFYKSDYGIAVVSDEEIDKAHLRLALRYLVYERPNADTLYKTLVSRNPGKAHPRVLFKEEDFNRALNLVKTNKIASKWSESILKKADELIALPMPVMAYDSADLRLQNLPSVHDLLTIYWAYLVTDDEKYIEYMIDAVMATCNNYTCWGHTKHYLEVGETCGAMGFAFDILYDRLTKKQRDLLAGKIVEYGLIPSKERYHGNHPYGGLVWPTYENNWNIVVNKGLIMAAIAIGDEYEPELSMDILEKAIRSCEFMMPTFAPEGAWGEGPAYWEYTIFNTMRAIQSLETALGTDYGISDTPGFLKTGYYPFNISGNSGVFAYHDTNREYIMSGVASVFKLALLAKDPNLAALHLDTMEKNNSMGEVTALMWYDPEFIGKADELPLDCFYESSQVATARSSWNSDAVWMGIHAGKNNFPHGHIDIGSFEYEADGVKFACDMGRDNYNLPGYWNTKERNLYIGRAEGHNVYVINPDFGAGQDVDGEAVITKLKATPDESVYSIDMTMPYASWVKEAKRTFSLTDKRRVFTVRDDIIPLGDDEYYWFWQTPAEIKINSDGKSVTLTNKGVTVMLGFEANVDFKIEKGLSVPLPTSPVVEGQLDNLKNTVNKLTVRFRSHANIPIEFTAKAVAVK